MAFYRALVSLENDSALPVDVAQNTYHFETSGIGDEQDALDDIGSAIGAVYDALATIMSSALNGNMRTRIYNMDDAPPRVPVWDGVDTFGPPTQEGLPNEVAIAVSYQAAIVSGVNRRRARGRVYIGPVGINADSLGVGDQRVSVSANNAIIAAFGPWIPEVPSPTYGGTIAWSVFSRMDALGLPVGAPPPATEPNYTLAQLADGYRPVVTAWVDNAFDSQRRRGLAATVRTPIT